MNAHPGTMTSNETTQPTETEIYDKFNPARITEGNYVMIKLPSQNVRLFRMNKNGVINLGKFGTFRVNDILGHPFGYTYEIIGEKQLRVVSDQFNKDTVDELEPDEHNQELNDDPSAQQLTMEEIEQLKKESADGGREIIEKVISSHSAFLKKTTFSQEKYIKRKEQKFLKRFTPVPVGTSELLEFYLDKETHKVLDVSEESLGLVLSLANIKPGGTYLVVDDMSGLLVAALLERMQNEGTIVVAHESEHANLDCLKYMNLSEEYIEKHVKSINWLDFFEPDQAEEFTEQPSEKVRALRTHQRRQYYRRKARHDNFQFIRNIIDNKKFDALVVGTDLFLPTLIPKLLPVVGGSRPIVIYDPRKESLLETWHVLQKDLRVLAPTLMETRVRKYQTLPGRFHPHMTMRGGGGYVLWGTRVFPSENVNAVKITRGRKRKAPEEDANANEVKKQETEQTQQEAVPATVNPEPAAEQS